jgi:FlaA1/EpsC-like NDP-sugar epimerase
MRHRLQPDIVLDQAAYLAVISLSVTAAFLLRFDYSIPAAAIPALKTAIGIALLVKLPVFHLTGLHRGLRRFASIPDLRRLFFGNLTASALFVIMAMIWSGTSIPGSVWVIDWLLCFIGTALVRFSVRICNEAFGRERPEQGRKGILIYGAGAAGTELLREIRSSRSTAYEAKGFLDDDPKKRRALIMGVPVLGVGREALSVVDRLNRRKPVIEEIIIAMPSATGPQMREALANCRAAKIPCKTIPGVDELLNGKVLSAQVRNLSVTDLLGRQPVKLDETPIRSSIAGRSVLITGAAGSIGSELCRQVARFEPARLIAFDQAESELFKIESELREKFRDLELVAVLGDIRDSEHFAEVLGNHSVDSIFHAAAYKHVPLLESHVLEGVRNNVLGTWRLVCEARRFGVKSFLQISSDKAVNPTNVMGATKRICERIVSAESACIRGRDMKCVSVRFGNVLGSNGSVVPIFQAQIQAGGPVKVTHPDMRRYFMTTAEAVSLVLQASTMGKGSEIFVLDMGEPVRIADLAANMIRLAGLVPGEDVEIQFTGTRPGEKLFEEMNGKGENMLPTYHEKIHIFQEPPMHADTIAEWIDGVEELVAARQELGIIEHIRKLVPEFHPNGKWGACRPEEELVLNGHKISSAPSLAMNGRKWMGWGEMNLDATT